MRRAIVKITESRLHNLIAESIKTVMGNSSTYLNEEREFLFENEGGNMKKARQYLEQHRYSPEQRQKILDAIRTDIPNSRLQQCKFLLGVTRMYLDGQLRDGHAIGELNKTLKYIASDTHVNEYDNNLNGENLDTLVKRFSGVAKEDLAKSKAESDARKLTKNTDYTIVSIDSAEAASKYGKYTSWCITHNQNMYDSYTQEGSGRFYFCLRRGFENEPQVKGPNCPLDSYGLSMIAVSVTMEGEVNTITCRWNHDMGGNDNILTVKELEDILGVNFYQTFKPYTREELHAKGVILVDEVQDLLDSGKSPKMIFDDFRAEIDGLLCVKLHDKWNIMNTKRKLLLDIWVDFIGVFFNDFAIVVLGRKQNHINTKGKLLSDTWFDGVGKFYGGLSIVRMGCMYNFINKDGKILSNKWFDDVDFFDGEFAIVKLNGKMNFLGRDGDLISNKWFDRVHGFDNGMAVVRLNGKENYISNKGRLISEIWFDEARPFYFEFGSLVGDVKINGEWYSINEEGMIISKEW